MRDLANLVRGHLFAPIWLIAGAEHLIVVEAADAVRQRARELGYEREVHDVDAQFDWDELVRSASAMSLFASRKLIELRLPTGRPGKEGASAIIAFCEAPPPDTVLLVTCHEWSRKHEAAWSSAIDKLGVQLLAWPVKRDELPRWIEQRLRSRGLKPTPEATALLADRVEGNLLAAAQEIDKLALLVGDRELDVATLEECVADDARYDSFRLTDAALAGDAVRALQIVEGLRSEGEELIPLLGWVVNQLRQLLQSAGGGGGYDPRQSLFRRALKVAPISHWERCIDQAGLIDRIVKGRVDGDPWREMSRLIAAIAAPPRAATLLAS